MTRRLHHSFSAVFHRHRDKTVLGILVALSTVLMLLPHPARIGAVRGILDVLFVPVERWTDFVEDYVSTRAENARLRRMVTSLMLERERLLEFRTERERLRRLVAFKKDQFYKLTPAEVIGRTTDRYQSVLVIDKGAADSLRVRMPVFSYQGLAGRVVRVADHSAWVQLLSSRNQAVSCIDKRSRVVGILEWRVRDVFELTSVSAVEDVAPGDTLLTSGFGGVVPKGFPVAVVTQVRKADDGLSLRVLARSRVNFRSLEEVFVMTGEVPWDQAVFYEYADTLLMHRILRGAE